MSINTKATFAIIIIFTVGWLSVSNYKDRKSYLLALKTIDSESIESITVFGSESGVSLTSRRKEVAECLQTMKPGLVRGGTEVVPMDIRLHDGGHLQNNLVLLHASKSVVFGYGENSFFSPSRGIERRNSSFTGVSKCMYSVIYE